MIDDFSELLDVFGQDSKEEENDQEVVKEKPQEEKPVKKVFGLQEDEHEYTIVHIGNEKFLRRVGVGYGLLRKINDESS